MKKFELSEEELDTLIYVLDGHCFEFSDPKALSLHRRLIEVQKELQQEDEEES